jgi:hypothetical protein
MAAGGAAAAAAGVCEGGVAGAVTGGVTGGVVAAASLGFAGLAGVAADEAGAVGCAGFAAASAGFGSAGLAAAGAAGFALSGDAGAVPWSFFGSSAAATFMAPSSLSGALFVDAGGEDSARAAIWPINANAAAAGSHPARKRTAVVLIIPQSPKASVTLDGENGRHWAK